MFGNFGGSNMTWILVLLLIMDNGDEGGCSCDSLIWLLLLSRFCGLGDGSTGCGCGCNGTTTTRSCGC